MLLTLSALAALGYCKGSQDCSYDMVASDCTALTEKACYLTSEGTCVTSDDVECYLDANNECRKTTDIASCYLADSGKCEAACRFDCGECAATNEGTCSRASVKETGSCKYDGTQCQSTVEGTTCILTGNQCVERTQYCEVLAPTCPQKFDNGAGHKCKVDDHINFTLGGHKRYKISSPFRNLQGEEACWINYSLKLKGTDTDAKTEYGGNIYLIHGEHDGYVTIGINYQDYQRFRATHEQTDPEFEIVAQGRSPEENNVQYSPVKARLSFKIKFTRSCNAAGTYSKMTDLLGKTLTFIPSDSPAKIQIPSNIELHHETTRATCDYYNNRELEVYIRPYGQKSGSDPLTAFPDPSIFTIDQKDRSLTIAATKDEQIKFTKVFNATIGPEVVCALNYNHDKECTVQFIFREKGIDGYYDELAYANV